MIGDSLEETARVYNQICKLIVSHTHKTITDGILESRRFSGTRAK